MNRILVIDDAATVRMYHRKILGDAGWHTEEASNGVEALERVHTQADGEAFDLYVVDVNMPKLDGYGFLHELRAQAIVQAPAIMVSTEAGPDDRTRAYAAGANAYLVKPVKPEQLRTYAKLLLGGIGGAPV